MSPSEDSPRPISVLALSAGPVATPDLRWLERLTDAGYAVTWAALSVGDASPQTSVTVRALRRDTVDGVGHLRWLASNTGQRLALLLRLPGWLNELSAAASFVVPLDAPAEAALSLLPDAGHTDPRSRVLASLAPALIGLSRFDPDHLLPSAESEAAAIAVEQAEAVAQAGLGRRLPLTALAEAMPPLMRAKRAAEVRRLADALGELLPDHTPGLRAWSDLTLDATTQVDVRAAARTSLRAADAVLARRSSGDLTDAQVVRAAADHLYLALEVLFHRELHSDTLTSPLVSDPQTYLEPLRESRIGRLLAPPPADQSAPAQQTLADDARIATVIAGPYGVFHQPVVAALRAASSTSTHFLRPRDVAPGLGGMTLDVTTLRALLGLRLRGSAARRSHQPLLRAVEESDVVVADWAGKTAALLSWYLPRPTRLVLRVHSVDALRAWLHLIDWSRVETLVCVAEHIAVLVRDLLGSRLDTVTVVVVPPHIDNERFARVAETGSSTTPEPGGVRPARNRTLVMIGWAQRVKDPVWTLEVLARLRSHDPSWRLLLVGHGFPEEQTAGGREYAALFRDRVAEPDVRDGVEYVPFTDDLPPVLARAGFVVSASRREGHPVGTTEAVAAGCVPVVRDWPLFQATGAARSLYDDWVVASPDAAAQRILDLGDESERAAAARRAATDLPDPVRTASTWRALVFGDHARLGDLRDQGRHEESVALVQQILDRGSRSAHLLAQAERSAREAGEWSLQFRACEDLVLATRDDRYLRTLRRLVGRMRETDPAWDLTVSAPPSSPPEPRPGRVLHVLKASLPARQSGYALRTHHLLRAQQDQGLDPVGVTALDFPGAPGGTGSGERWVDRVDSVDYHRLVRAAVPQGEPIDVYLQAWADHLLDLALQVRPSVIHAHSGHRGYESGLVGAAVARALGIPFVYEVRGFFEAMWTDDLARAEKAEAYHRRRDTENRLMAASAAVVTLSGSMADDLVDRGVPTDRIHVVPNGVDPPEPVSPTGVDALRRHLGLERAFVVGYISNLDHFREGQELLVEAAARLRAAGIPAVALIVGDGRRAAEVRGIAQRLGAEEATRFTGSVPHQDVAAHYALCDVFVVPRVDERAARLVTPMKPYEAMARRIPLLVSDLPALTEIIGGDARGWSFRAGDVASLTTALRALHDAPPAAVQERVQRAAEWVLSERSWAANVALYPEFYANLQVTSRPVGHLPPEEWGARYQIVHGKVRAAQGGR